MLSPRASALGLLLATITVAAQENRFANPSFEELDAGGAPAHWTPVDFGTGGGFAVGADGGKTGDRYVILRASEEKHRSCWRQLVLWSDADEGVTAGGWYRTRGVAAGEGKGASIRFLFNHDPAKWEHLRLDTVYFPPSQEWAEAKASFSVPRGTRAIVIEFFHWYTPGETHWDDVWIRPATKGEVQVKPLDAALAVDREPIYGLNLPYSPADGETVEFNPPPFRWLPSGDVTYRLQVARAASFQGPKAVDLERLQWCAEMLTRPLQTGVWYWRYGVDRRGAETIWSKARRFEVPPDATLWAYPGREALKAPEGRPRLFIPAARLADFRRRATEGDLRGTADALVAGVKKYAGEDLVPEPGWLPKDATERAQTYTTIIRTTRPPMDRMEQAALAYLLTRDGDCGTEAKRRILHFFSWDPAGPTGVFHNDEPAMWVMMRGVRAYDWTYDLFTPEERARVEAAMRLRAADFYKKLRAMPYENNPFESHAGRIIGFLGGTAIAFLNEWPESVEWLDYVTRIYWGVYPAWGKDDGGWNEGPGYWSAYMSFALHFVVALREATGIDLSARPFFRNTPYYLLYLAPPHSQMSPFGDGTQWKPSRHGGLMYLFGTLIRDPHIRWYADVQSQSVGGDILGVVLKDDTLPGEAPVGLPTATLFEGVGLACLHTSLTDGEQDVAFVMRSSPYGAVSHGHNDQNCFVLEAYGEPLAIASGYYNYYGSPHHDRWTRQTKAKCGITFDGGIGQERGWQAQGRVTAFQHTDAFDLVTGDATRAYGGKLTRAIREVVHVRPGVFVIRDDLASDTPRRFEYWLHSIDPMQVDEAGGTVIIARPKAALTTRFLCPTALSITQTDQFDPPPTWPPDAAFENNWHVTAALRAPEAQTEFLTVLLPTRAGEEDQLPTLTPLETETARGVELAYLDGSKTLVGFAKPGAIGEVTVGDVVTDARVFAVRRDALGQVGAWMVWGGMKLQVGGRAVG